MPEGSGIISLQVRLSRLVLIVGDAFAESRAIKVKVIVKASICRSRLAIWTCSVGCKYTTLATRALLHCGGEIHLLRL